MTAAMSHHLGRRAALAGLGAMGLSALCLGHANSRAQTAGKPLRLAVVPQLTPIEMSRFWTPVVDAMERAGIACELILYPSIASFEPEFLKGTADLVFLNPYHMVMAHKAHGYEPLLHDTRPLEGVLVVREDSQLQRIEQLRLQRISFPAPNAFAASLYIRSVLDKQYHMPIDAHYAQNHRDAIRQVLSGDAQAAGVVKTTLEKESLEVQRQLRIIYTTPPLSPHPLAAHPRVSQRVRSELVSVLLGLASNPTTQALMAGIQMPKPVPANYARDYASLEHLSVEKYVVVE
jgi:phosphonate transport system substrate-binding protein